jgi:hypothetical protein
MKLREREEKLASLKKRHKKKQRQRRGKDCSKEIVLEESDIPTKKLYRILNCLNGKLLIGTNLI